MAKYRYAYHDGAHRFHKIDGNQVVEIHIFGDLDDVLEAHIASTNSVNSEVFLKRESITKKDFKAGFNVAMRHLKKVS